jgi:hypothetical protein
MKKNYLFLAFFLPIYLVSNSTEKNLEEKKTKILNNLNELKQEMITHQIVTENTINNTNKEISCLHTNLKELEISISQSEIELVAKAYEQESKRLEKLKEEETKKIKKLEKEKSRLEEEEIKKNNYLKTLKEKIKEIETNGLTK